MPIIQMIGMLFNNTLFYITDMYIPSYFLDFLLGNSIITTILLYICSYVFGFCKWHRLIITANFINLLIANIDSIYKINISDLQLLLVYYFIYAIFIIINTYNHIKGPHFDEDYAKYQVTNMYHTDKNGNVCKKEFYNISDAKTIYDKYVRNINSENTVWDVYVALNAQYHDYIKLYKDWFTNITKEELDDKIITSCINFWFKDEDAGVGKVWNYFKNIG